MYGGADDVLEVLMAGVESSDALRVTLAVSALWSLLHNNSKVSKLVSLQLHNSHTCRLEFRLRARARSTVLALAPSPSPSPSPSPAHSPSPALSPSPAPSP